MSEVITMRPKSSFLEEGFIEFCKFLKERNVTKILEIGSYAGESLMMYKKYLGKDVLVVSIDPWDKLDDENDLIHNNDFNKVEQLYNANTLNERNIVKCKMYSQDISNMFSDGFFDCLYVDGLHTYEQVKIDLLCYKSKVKEGGLICGHDYDIEYTDKQRAEIRDFEGNDRLRKAVSKAVNEIVGKPNLTFGDSSWVKLNLDINK
jgi:hypothetical protein